MSIVVVFFLMIRRPPRSTQSRSSAASDVYKRQESSPGIAWWVGWVEKGTEVYFFAFNMDIDNESKLPSRKSIPTKIMASEGIIIGG